MVQQVPAVEDRDAIQEIVRTAYRAISGAAGAARDWAAFRTCYAADARIAPFNISDGGGVTFDVMNVEQYIASRDPRLLEVDFFEVETKHDCRIEGRIAHVYSHYEARHDPSSPPFTSGVNSIELVNTGDGWKIVFETWQFTGFATPAART